jgi:hypothetical protein
MLSIRCFSGSLKKPIYLRHVHAKSPIDHNIRNLTTSKNQKPSLCCRNNHYIAFNSRKVFGTGKLHSYRSYCSLYPHETTKSKFTFKEWKNSTIQRLKEKKAQVLVEYGSTFVFLHETLGIASYFMCFGIASFGIINIDDIITFIGIVPDNIKEMVALKKDGLATTAVTALILLKCFDFMGLTPLRWAIAITLTPRIAWWIGPKIDAVIAAIKSRLPNKSKKSIIAESVVPVVDIIQQVDTTQSNKTPL